MKKSLKSLSLLSALAVGMILNSCDSLIFDDQGDCSVHYRVPITFTKNMLDADAFSSQVTSVTLCAFDADGNLALRQTESGAALAVPDYAMEVELNPGRYTMVAWAEGKPSFTPATSFVIGENPATVTELMATLPLQSDAATSTLYCNQDIVPLFHGSLAPVDLPDTYGTITTPTIDLTKDTNIIEVVLENIEGSPIAPDALTVSIQAANSQLDWNNTVIGNTTFSYRPWSTTSLESQRQESTARGTDAVSGLMSELTTGRLMADRRPVLVVHRNHDDKDIVRLDLVKFLCMVKGHYPGDLSDQEYLDRMDRHVLTFFVDADLNWYTVSGININGWKVVPPQDNNL